MARGDLENTVNMGTEAAGHEMKSDHQAGFVPIFE